MLIWLEGDQSAEGVIIVASNTVFNKFSQENLEKN